MLPTAGLGIARRIKRKREIQTIFKDGIRFSCGTFRLTYLPNCAHYDRMAVLVKRADGNAVRRNRIKRVCREIFRTCADSAAPYYDILIRPHSSIARHSAAFKQEYCSWRKSLHVPRHP